MSEESPLQKILREELEKREEANRRHRILAASLAAQNNPFTSFLGQSLQPVKRKVFISFFHDDETEVKEFIRNWTVVNTVFIPKALCFDMGSDIIDSTSPTYVMSQIRKKYLQDSTVTIVLIGSCTHSRRYVDWEIKTSLRQGTLYTPNGLIGILLPSLSSAHLPQRFSENWNRQNQNCYAHYYAPTSAVQLRGWIEDAYRARTTRVAHINNSSDMMKYNSVCKVCNKTH